MSTTDWGAKRPEGSGTRTETGWAFEYEVALRALFRMITPGNILSGVIK